MELASPAFADGEPIPERYGYTEANVNPPLEIRDVPEDAESLALVMDDPDAREPAGKIWDHWVVADVDPDRTEIPEDWSPNSAVEGSNDYGERGYGGPNPPDRPHAYQFRAYALDTTVDAQPGISKEEIREEMSGDILDEAGLEGTYAP